MVRIDSCLNLGGCTLRNHAVAAYVGLELVVSGLAYYVAVRAAVSAQVNVCHARIGCLDNVDIECKIAYVDGNLSADGLLTFILRTADAYNAVSASAGGAEGEYRVVAICCPGLGAEDAELGAGLVVGYLEIFSQMDRKQKMES